MSMRRRDFLKLSAAAGVTVAAPITLAGAADDNYEGPYFAVFNASGGWDTTYLMDPKGVNDLNRLYNAGDILTAGNIRYAPTEGRIASGAMTNRAFFDKYYRDLLVINGIDVSVNNHSPCSRYVATGKLDSLRFPAFPALVAAAKAPEVPLAFLTFGGYSNTGNVIAKTRIPYVSRLQRLARADHVNSDSSDMFHHPLAIERIEGALRDVDERGHALPKIRRANSFIYAAQINSKALSRVEPWIPSSLPEDQLQRQVEIGLAGFASGLAVSANFKLGTFDSHDTNDPDQMDLIPKLLAGVDHLMERAAEIGIQDKLVVIMQSEMGRTPWYNDTGGKDHWSINSMMMMGAGISGNRVVGQTTVDPETGNDQSAAVINPRTLANDSGGVRIRPEHVQTALRELAGIDSHPSTQLFDFGVPSEERLVGLFG